MRIIAGALRGRRLASVGKGDARAHLRPTSDRVRESLFGILESNHRETLLDAQVLDVFAGTGALGLEALSRGAAHVTFIEQGRAALKLLSANIESCGVGDVTRILTRDARKPGPAPQEAGLVFLDPPYGKGLGEQALTALIAQGWLGREALIVWEDNADVAPPETLEPMDARRYGDTMIRLFRHMP